MARERVLITGATAHLSRQFVPLVRECSALALRDRCKPQDIDDIIVVNDTPS